MSGRSKKAGQRLLILKHNRWWFRRAIPVACQRALGRGAFYMVNLGTSDLKAAQRLRDELERETSDTFAAIRAGKMGAAAVLSARERGLLYRETLAAHAEDQQDGPDAPAGLYDIAVDSAESVAEQFRDEADRAAFLDALHGREDVTAHLDAHLATLRKNRIVEKSVKEREGLVRAFAKWAADQKPALTLDRIDRKQAGKYVAEKLDDLHPKTQSKHLMALRGYWNQLAARGLVDLPPQEPRGSGWPWNAQQIRHKATRAERESRNDQERPFTDAEAKTLLYAPFPSGMQSAHEAQIRDAIRISLLSGMRMVEVL